jgi:hypothetical protein
MRSGPAFMIASMSGLAGQRVEDSQNGQVGIVNLRIYGLVIVRCAELSNKDSDRQWCEWTIGGML